jgi:hypothetical protein
MDIETAVERLRPLRQFTQETGTLTNKLQGRLLSQFTDANQSLIIARLMGAPKALCGVGGAK